jgi:integrase
LAEFLHAVRDDRLFALWWLLALRGLRRGEAAALRWSDIDLDHATLDVVRARTTAGYQVFEGGPKTDAGLRTVALDKHTGCALKRHLSDVVYKRMLRDAAAAQPGGTGPGGHSGATLQSSADGPIPTAASSDKSQPGPAISKPKTTSPRPLD